MLPLLGYATPSIVLSFGDIFKPNRRRVIRCLHHVLSGARAIDAHGLCPAFSRQIGGKLQAAKNRVFSRVDVMFI